MTNEKRVGLWARLFGAFEPEKPVERVEPRLGLMIKQEAVARAAAEPLREVKPFRPAPIPEFIKAAGVPELAMDNNIATASNWAGGYWGQYSYAFTEGMEFLGYPYLAELAQRPEYRRIVEIIAQEMTRKWIRITSTSDGDKDKKNDKARAEKITKITAEMERLNVREVFKTIAEQDGFFGRAHLYLDTGDSDKPEELKTSIGNGDDAASKNKVSPKKPLLALRAVEAVWTYPTQYNSNDPLKGDWYNPDMWFVMGKQVHVSRLLCFIGRPVPDLLKPAYSFGGLAMTQMAKPYVDNWLTTRQGVNDIISSFTAWVLKTNMSSILNQGGGEEETLRAMLFNNFRNNRGLMMVDKNEEDFDNISVPLGSLDALQSQAQEHMSSVAGIPQVKLFGIQPAGMNASSEGEIRVFYDTIAAVQSSFFRDNLTKVICFVQLSLFGEVDPSITFEFEPLYALSEKEQGEVDKLYAEADQIRIDSGVISPEEARTAIANDAGSRYQDISPDDADDVPDLREEEEEGLEPKGGKPIDELFDGKKNAA